MNLTGIKVIVLDLGGTLLYPKSGNWYLTEPLIEFMRQQNCSDRVIAESIAYAKHATECEIRAYTIEEEIRIYSHFYHEMLNYMGKCKLLSDDDLRRFSVCRTSASELYRLNWQAINTLRLIRTKVSIALFSNSWPSVIKFLYDEKVLDLFTYRLFSCKTGLKKPDPRFFKLLLTVIHCEPGEVILYDDSINVTEMAMAFGIKARLVTFDTLNEILVHDFSEEEV